MAVKRTVNRLLLGIVDVWGLTVPQFYQHQIRYLYLLKGVPTDDNSEIILLLMLVTN